MNGNTKKVVGGAAGLTLAGLLSAGIPVYNALEDHFEEKNLLRERINQIEMDSCTRDEGWHWYRGECMKEE